MVVREAKLKRELWVAYKFVEDLDCWPIFESHYCEVNTNFFSKINHFQKTVLSLVFHVLESNLLSLNWFWYIFLLVMVEVIAYYLCFWYGNCMFIYAAK